MPMRMSESLKLTTMEGPIKKKIIPDKSVDSIRGTRLSTLFGKCFAIWLEVKKKVGQMAKKIPIYIDVRLKSVSLSARMGSISA